MNSLASPSSALSAPTNSFTVAQPSSNSSSAVLQNSTIPTNTHMITPQQQTNILHQSRSAEQLLAPSMTGRDDLSPYQQLNFNSEAACMQFVLLCAENERLTFGYLQKEREVEQLQRKLNSILSNQNNTNEVENMIIKNNEINQQTDLEYAQIQIKSLQEQVSMLKQHLAESNSRCDKQAAQLGSLNQSSLQLSHQALLLAEKDTQILAQTRENREMKKYIEVLEGEVEIIRKKFNSESQLQVQMSQKQDEESKSAMQSRKELENELVKVQNHCELLLAENEKLQKALMLRISENEALREEIDIQSRVQVNNEETQGMIEELRVNIESLLSDNNKLCESNRQLSSQLEGQQRIEQEYSLKEKRLKQRISDLEYELNVGMQQAQIKQQDNFETDERIRKAEKQTKELIFEIEKLKSAIEIKDIKLKEFNAQFEEMQGEQEQLTDLKREYGLLNARCKEIEKQLLSVQEERNNWKMKYSSIESSSAQQFEETKQRVQRECREESERETTWLTARLQAAEGIKEQLQQKVQQLETRSMSIDSQLKEWREKVNQLQEELQESELDRSDRKAKNAAMEQQIYHLQEKQLLVRIENERLHAVLMKLQGSYEDTRKQLDSTIMNSKKQHTDMLCRFTELDELNRNLKIVISDYQDQIAVLEKQAKALRQQNFKIDDLENKNTFITREYDNIKLKLIESEAVKQSMKAKLQEANNQLVQYTHLDQQLSFLTKENERLQKLIMERCRQSAPFW